MNFGTIRVYGRTWTRVKSRVSSKCVARVSPNSDSEPDSRQNEHDDFVKEDHNL
jgi:hypothetical protein